MQRTSFKNMRCSLAQALELVGDWWTPLIVRDVFLGLHRFDELVENLGVSRNLLTRRLAMLTKHKIVARKVYFRRPVRYEYRLTAAGEELVPILAALTAGGDRWSAPAGGAAIEFVHTACGHRFAPRIVCSECGEEIAAATTLGVARPGARSGPGVTVIARKLGQAT